MEGDEDGLAEAQTRGRWRRKARRPSAGYSYGYAGLGERVEAILQLAEAEASKLREEARQTATALIEKAEQDAAQIRADAQAEARAIRAAGEEQGRRDRET